MCSKYHFKSKTASDFELRSKSQENFRFAKIPNDFSIKSQDFGLFDTFGIIAQASIFENFSFLGRS